MTFTYQDLISRNRGYIDSATQVKIAQTRVLIAGCGIGSQVAEAAVRIGFQKFILVDGDRVEVHNLNRQFFFAAQVGQDKVAALRENIMRINPSAEVETRKELLTTANAAEIVKGTDLIFDTIDFLDLNGIVALHDQAHCQKKILVSSFSVGFGAAVICFPPDSRDHAWIREIFGLPLKGDIGSASYSERYQKLFTALASGLDPSVLGVMQKVFSEIADGHACPAPQIAPGAHAVAAICVTTAVRLLEGNRLTLGPQMIVLNLLETLQNPGFALVLPRTKLRSA